MKSIKSLRDIKGKKVLVRVDFNVPIKNGIILDDYRIKKTIPTIKFLKNKGAKIILISHIEGGKSLEPVSKELNKFVKNNFVKDILGEKTEKKIKEMKNSEVILLENLRKNEGEVKNDINFAKKLSSLADIYVNEAFSVSHRKHASIVSVPKFLPTFLGLQYEEEIKNLDKLKYKSKIKRPFLFILGGAKFDTKMPLIKKYLKIADFIFIGGALANNFFKEKGFEIGKSLIDSNDFRVKSIMNNNKIILPIDVVTKSSYKSKIVENVLPNEKILDVGEKSLEILKNCVKKSKTILFNGPLGNYEMGYEKATIEILREISKHKCLSIVGGGDTVVLVQKAKLEKKLSFVSTGGGAMIEYLVKN